MMETIMEQLQNVTFQEAYRKAPERRDNFFYFYFHHGLHNIQDMSQERHRAIEAQSKRGKLISPTKHTQAHVCA